MEHWDTTSLSKLPWTCRMSRGEPELPFRGGWPQCLAQCLASSQNCAFPFEILELGDKIDAHVITGGNCYMETINPEMVWPPQHFWIFEIPNQHSLAWLHMKVFFQDQNEYVTFLYREDCILREVFNYLNLTQKILSKLVSKQQCHLTVVVFVSFQEILVMYYLKFGGFGHNPMQRELVTSAIKKSFRKSLIFILQVRSI